jgi:hypothetical protein
MPVFFTAFDENTRNSHVPPSYHLSSATKLIDNVLELRYTTLILQKIAQAVPKSKQSPKKGSCAAIEKPQNILCMDN